MAEGHQSGIFSVRWVSIVSNQAFQSFVISSKGVQQLNGTPVHGA